jgi:glycosyltransferase involved in cell wall biosynthesis
VEEHFGLRPQAIVHPEMRAELFDGRSSPPADVDQAKPFFLCAATNEPRKNIRAAIEAFLELRASGRIGESELVLAGDAGWKNGRVLQLLAQTPEGWIRQLGYVSNSELAWLFKHCQAFLFPSFYEGFGMPVQEARVLGARVVCTDMPELREAGDDFCQYVPPTVAGIQEGLAKAWEMPGGVPSKPYDRSAFQREVDQFAKLFLGQSRKNGPNP